MVNPMFLRFPIGIARSLRIRQDDKAKCCENWLASIPALEAHPQIDRYLLSKPSPDSTKTAPHYDQLSLESARRRAFFEWTEEHIEQIAGERHALDLARGRHLRLFRNLPLEKDPQEQAKLCARLCAWHFAS